MAQITVTIQSMTFNPDPLPIHVGDSVVWNNQDAMDHTATADDGSWDAGLIGPGQSSTPIAFHTAGTSAYSCQIHPFMHGTVTVA